MTKPYCYQRCTLTSLNCDQDAKGPVSAGAWNQSELVSVRVRAWDGLGDLSLCTPHRTAFPAVGITVKSDQEDIILK